MPQRRREDIIPPHLVEEDTSASVLGSILRGGVDVFDICERFGLDLADFANPALRRIYQTVSDLVDEEQPIDVASVVELLDRRDHLELVGGIPYVANLPHRTVDDPPLEHWVETMRERTAQRQILSVTEECREAIHRGDPSESILENMGAAVDAIDGGRRLRFSDVSAAVDLAVARLDETAETQPGVRSGLTQLDWLLRGGFQRGRLYVVGARTGTGKSAFAVSSTVSAARANVRTGFLSLEMSAPEIVERAISCASGVQLRPGLSEEQRRQFGRGASEVATWGADGRLLLDASCARDWPSVRAQIPRLVYEGAEIVWLDHLGRIDVPDNAAKRLRTDQQLGLITKDLSVKADKLQVPIVICVQLNRETERQPNAKPGLLNLKNSGDIEEDADGIIFLWRRASGSTMESGVPGDGEAKVILAKHRRGMTGEVLCGADMATSRFYDLRE